MRQPEAFDVELLRTADGITKVQDEWTRFLEERAGDHNAFHHPDIIRHDLSENVGVYTPFILIMRRRGRIVGIAPWYIHQLRFPLKLGVINIGRVPLRLLKLFGGSIVTDREISPDSIARQALESARNWRSDFHVLALFDIPVTGELWQLVTQATNPVPGFRPIPATPEPIVKREIALPETFEVFLASLSSKKRNSLRRHERDLMKQSDDTLTFDRITDPADVPAYLGEVEQVYRRSWQGQTMGGQRASESQTRFLQRVAEHGWFRSYIVRCNAAPVCYGLGYQYGGVYYGEDMAYDIEWRQCAPGNYMFIKLIEDLFDSDTPRMVEFGTGDNVFKQQFSNTMGAAQTIYLVPRGKLYGASVIRTQRFIDRLYRFGHSTVSRLGIDRWVRERIKRRKRAHSE
jgi:hypothetical protein